MKREILLVGGGQAGRYIQADDHPVPSVRFPVIKDMVKFVPDDGVISKPEFEYEVYQLQQYRSANGAEFFWYVLEGIDALEELIFIYTDHKWKPF